MVATPAWLGGVPDDVLDDLSSTFTGRAGHPIARGEAGEIAHNTRGFFQVLERWAREQAARGVGPLSGADLKEAPFVDPD